jgi:GntR family transcriptional regulator
VSFTEKARAAGKVPTTSLLTFGPLKVAEVDPEVVAMLRVQPTERLWELDRLRSIDAITMILENRFVVESLCPYLTRAQVQGSLYQTWTESYGLAIAGADEVVRAVLLTNEEARHL